jgi:hypothetical protein
MRLLALALALLSAPALAQQPILPPPPAAPTPAAPTPAAAAWVARPVAELVALDKITARPSPLSLRVGQSASFGSLSITVRACVSRPPDVAADAAMFLDIVDAHAEAPQFHGWMIVSAPAVAMLEHPVYDVRPAGCHS